MTDHRFFSAALFGGALAVALFSSSSCMGPDERRTLDARPDVAPDARSKEVRTDVGSTEARLADRQPSEVRPCVVRQFPVNAQVPFTDTALCSAGGERLCTIEPDGSSTFSYSVPNDKCWATCEFSEGQDLNPFNDDPDAMLEVILCVPGNKTAQGTLNLYYGSDPCRRFVNLVAANDSLPAGCQVKYFRQPDVQDPDWFKEKLFRLDSSCRPCPAVSDAGPADPECQTPRLCSDCCKKGTCFRELSLTAELWSQTEPFSGVVQLVSIRHYTARCECQHDGDCGPSDELTCRKWSTSAKGICARRRDDCNSLVGRYAEGLREPQSSAFFAAYSKLQPSIGCPDTDPAVDPAAVPFVHAVPATAGVELQLFKGGIASNPWTVLIYNPSLQKAFLVVGRFFETYQCLRDKQQGKPLGGGTLLGAPAEEQHSVYTDGGLVVRQGFEHGSLTLVGATMEVRLTSRSQDADPGKCTSVALIK